MIVDDRVAIIGSANINDRSMLGDRDSEICVLIRDTEMINSTMNGQEYQVGKFAHELRMHLFREHLGLSNDDQSIQDPIKDSVYRGIWISTACHNTQIYNQFFKDIPQDSIQDWADFQEKQKFSRRFVETFAMFNSENLPTLDQVNGHLIIYPLNFLQEVSLSPPLTTTDAWVALEVYQ